MLQLKDYLNQKPMKMKLWFKSEKYLNQLQESNKGSIGRTQNGSKGFKGIQWQSHDTFMDDHTHLISTSYFNYDGSPQSGLINHFLHFCKIELPHDWMLCYF